MLQRTKITDPGHPLFAQCWQLYTDAFPQEERRELDYHIETMRAQAFSFEGIEENGEFVGIIGWWQFDNLRFIEHLATSPAVRNKGYGKVILTEFIGEGSDPIILEVEHPECEMSIRRIEFYRRIGFHLNQYSYSHPPYDTTQSDFVSLMLMSYPAEISSSEADKFKAECYAKVHFRHNL
ncbi:MAG: GNAT family N-acetyltransferase [Rikenellaceae bacterium]